MRMLHNAKNFGLTAVAGLFGMFASGSAFAARLAEDQATYWGKFVELLILVVTSAMFLVSLVVLLIACWFLIRDYVMKDDREKRFSFAQLVVAMVVAGILGFPSGAYLVGQDLLSGSAGGSQIKADSFKRAGNGG